ncbi:MAG: GtrA family protein [Candidatus Heimdallarchaeaceae archaeon]|jgi:putative flippase GtrA
MKKEENLSLETKERDKIKRTSFISKERQIRLLKFAIVSTGGFGLTVLFVFLSFLVLDIYFVRENTIFSIWFLPITSVHIATLIAIIIVMIYNYIINKIWTFRKQDQMAEFNITIQFIKFAIVGASGTLINLGLVHLFFVILEWNEYLAIAIGFIVSVLTNFILNDIWTFNPRFGKKRTDFEEEN